MSTALTLVSPLRILAVRVRSAANDRIRHPLVLIACHWAALAFLRFPHWEFVGPLVLAMSFIPARRLRLMSGLNLAFAVVTGSLLSFSVQTVDSEHYTWPPPWVQGLDHNPWLIKGAIFAGFVLLYFLLFQSFARLKFIRHPVTVGAAVVAILVLLISVLEPATVSRGVLIGLLFAVSHLFWPLCYQLSETDLLRQIPFTVHLGTLSAPWQSGWASNTTTRGYGDYSNFEARDPGQFRKTQLSGLRLIGMAAVLQVGAELFSNFLFGADSPFSNWLGLEFSTSGFLGQTLPRPYAWLFVFSYTFYFLVSLAAFTHAAVSIARMCGFDVFRNVYRPLEAASFNNFLSRIYFYYIAILQRFFFYPIWRALRPIGHRRLRTCVTVLLTIFVGGMATSALRYLPLQTENFSAVWGDLTARVGYFGLLAVFCAVSAVLPGWPARWERPIPQKLRGLSYCALYALCYCAQMRRPEFDDLSGLRGLAYLFGF